MSDILPAIDAMLADNNGVNVPVLRLLRELAVQVQQQGEVIDHLRATVLDLCAAERRDRRPR